MHKENGGDSWFEMDIGLYLYLGSPAASCMNYFTTEAKNFIQTYSASDPSVRGIFIAEPLSPVVPLVHSLAFLCDQLMNRRARKLISRYCAGKENLSGLAPAIHTQAVTYYYGARSIARDDEVSLCFCLDRFECRTIETAHCPHQ